MVYNTQYNQQMYIIYNQLNHHFSLGKILRVAEITGGILLSIQGAYCTKPKGITLIESTQIRMFSKWSGGRGWSLLSEAKSLKTSSRDHQAQVDSIRWFSWWPGVRLVHVNEDQTRRLYSLMMLKWELENNSWQPETEPRTGKLLVAWGLMKEELLMMKMSYSNPGYWWNHAQNSV